MAKPPAKQSLVSDFTKGIVAGAKLLLIGVVVLFALTGLVGMMRGADWDFVPSFSRSLPDGCLESSGGRCTLTVDDLKRIVK